MAKKKKTRDSMAGPWDAVVQAGEYSIPRRTLRKLEEFKPGDCFMKWTPKFGPRFKVFSVGLLQAGEEQDDEEDAYETQPGV